MHRSVRHDSLQHAAAELVLGQHAHDLRDPWHLHVFGRSRKLQLHTDFGLVPCGDDLRRRRHTRRLRLDTPALSTTRPMESLLLLVFRLLR